MDKAELTQEDVANLRHIFLVKIVDENIWGRFRRASELRKLFEKITGEVLSDKD